MSILLHVSSLAGPLCSVRCEASWTGRQLKEAIEVETKWSELACTQTLAIGPRVVEDDDILGEDAKEGAEVSVGRSTLPAFVLVAPRDAQSWALALRGYPSRGFPVLVEARGYAFDGSGKELWDDIDQAYRKEIEERRPMYHPQEIELRHLPLEKDMLSTWVPWNAIAGIDPGEVSCVLALQASFDWAGDGMSWISSIAVLQDGALLAITAKIWEACSGCKYDSHIVSGLLRVKNLEELAARAPGFYEAMTLPLSHERHSQPEAGAAEPLGRGRSWIGDILGIHWRTGECLSKWQEAHGGRPTVRGWAALALPSKRFTDAWKMPDAFGELLTRSERSADLAQKRWEEAARGILQDETKTFGQMVDDFEAELGSEFFEPPALRAGLDRLRADAAKAANLKEFRHFFVDVNGSLGRFLYRDFAFGVNQTSIFYDELKSEDTKP